MTTLADLCPPPPLPSIFLPRAIRCWDLRMAYTRRDTNPRPSYTLPPVAVGCRPRGKPVILRVHAQIRFLSGMAPSFNSPTFCSPTLGIYSLSMDASGTMLLAGCTDGRWVGTGGYLQERERALASDSVETVFSRGTGSTSTRDYTPQPRPAVGP